MGADLVSFFTKLQTAEKCVRHFNHHLLFVSDSSGMWEEQEEEDREDDDDDEDEGLAGQLLSDIIASNKYGIRQHLCYSCILAFFKYIALHAHTGVVALFITLFLFIKRSFRISNVSCFFLQMMIIMRMMRRTIQMP